MKKRDCFIEKWLLGFYSQKRFKGARRRRRRDSDCDNLLLCSRSSIHSTALQHSSGDFIAGLFVPIARTTILDHTLNLAASNEREREKSNDIKERVTHAHARLQASTHASSIRPEEKTRAHALRENSKCETIRRRRAAMLVSCQCQLIEPTTDFRVDDLSIWFG